MDGLNGRLRTTGWGAFAPVSTAPDMLPGSEVSIIDWLDFSQTLNPLGMPEAFSPALNLLTRNPITPEEERTAQAQIPELLAKRYGVHPDCVAVGASATDVLAAVANSFEPRSVAVPVPSRAAYERCLGTAGHRIVEVPGPDGFVVPDPQAVRRMGLSFDAAMLANPAFPTSRLLARQTLLDYLQACAWVIVDERGIDLTFGGESTATMIDEHSNLIVIRSLTDTFSLPGMPLSCALAHPAVASRISQIAKRPASAALSARLLKLATPDHHLERAREVLETEIPWMQCMLSLVPGISIYPAEANYVMCSFAPGRSMHLGAADAPDLVRKLHKRGFPVRTLDRTPGVSPGSHFCVSVRTRSDNERFIAVLRQIVAGS
ncbi:aminotransferase class I/II-fold pyridoxal phosphate-dependent enzyme [uncultured Senegalimassilia sp.]|uniref:aminotransferase class I/II-fold pyridoxal phosphate-dependent enzyme n=1 Tax=uncultured Senegalimassilia sp. TaxID=1714350 RepID=UPI002583F8BF|nr:aminotransferase class I/II-fold pyridoxal phosphate-dependent enzyme [uncultured Senegalimassilia sp.]